MKLENIVLTNANFEQQMQELRTKKNFDYLVTIVGEDFGEEGLGCIYILENTATNERTSVKMIADKIGNDFVIPTVCTLWKDANLLEREVFDFLGIKFLGNPDMRRLYLRSDFAGYPLRKDFKAKEGRRLAQCQHGRNRGPEGCGRAQTAAQARGEAARVHEGGDFLRHQQL